ncbi:putative homeodomain transcription factor (phtf) [Schistosoma mansoni]|uniref:putative homeodomain transcription factor (phtf) n=1 Tax=Schistosoma mansoni TaxID=6183 RepID=UPI00022C83CC|nr:putative homeodomain transcription factor (phtf) [Schistosoma mansoni]|eukprot:XP_018644716.1 putative homeodomain transcription factor (phtf) [Schistosoma mansoni]
MVHFFLQFLQVVFFLLTDPRTSNSSQDDLLLPCLLAICLGILHAHITAPHGKTGLYSSFIDNPMTNQSFKDIGDHGLNSNCCQYNPDNLVNNKFSDIQSAINRHDEYDNSSWFPIQSTISEHHKFPTNIYSANHQSKNAPNPNKEPINSTSEQCGHSSSGRFECFKTSQLVDRNYAKAQRNINWRPGEMKPKRPLTSSYKFLKTHLDTDYQDDYSDLYGPGDDTQHELNISDVTHGTDGPQTPCTLDEECGRTKLLHNSQVLEHRSRVVRRRRRQNSYNSKLGNLSRGHDADVEESEGELVTVPSRKDIGEIGFGDQIVDGFNLDFIHQLQLKGGGSDHHFGSSNSDINPDSTVLPKRKQVSESPLDSSNLHTSAKLSNTLGDFSANTESSNKVGVLKTQSTSDSPIPLKTDQFTELECLPPHLSHISSLSSSFDSFVGSSRRSLKRSLSMSFPVHSKNTTTNVFLMLKKSFSDGLLNCLMNFHSSQCRLFGNELPYALKSPFQQKRDFQSNYNNTNDQAREVLKLCSNRRNRLSSENISYRKISLSSHSSGAAESSTNSARSFSSVRKFPKGNGRIFELESVHDVGAELTANPKCGRSSVDKHLDKKIYSSYTDIFKSQLIEDMKSTVQPVELSKEFQKLNELNEKRDVQPDNYGRSEFKNKSYECINKDDTITVFNRQRAKYLRLFLQRAFHLQHPRVVINSNQTDTDMLESDSVVLDSKWSNENSKYSGNYIPSSNNPDINFKPSNQRVSSLNSTNKSCLKSTSPKVFYNWSEAKSLSGNTNDHSQTTPTTDITNSQDAVTHAPKRHMKQYFGPVNGFVRNVYSHSHYFSKNESQDANMNGRGQTASENEYFDRINSDLGSDADSSSCPDEVESPSQPRENELRNWQHSNSMLDVNPDAAEKFRTVNKKQVSGRSDYHSCISKHYCPKCSSHLNVFLSPTTDSGQMNSFDDLKCVMNNNHQKPTESHKLYESVQSVNDNGKNESLSSVHEEILHSIDFEVKEKLSDNQVTKRNVSKIQINSHLTRDSNGHENLLPSKVDTGTLLFFGNNSMNRTFNTNNAVFGDTVIGLYLHAILSLFGHLFSTVSIKIHSTFIDTNLQTSSCSQSYCIVFWNIVTGQFLMDWFSKPDVQ